MRRIFTVISVVVFAVGFGCGEATESDENQGGGNGGGGGGETSPVDSDPECFDFGEDDRAEYDGAVENIIWSLQSTSTPWDPGCVVGGVGYDSTACVEMGEGVDQYEYYNICQEYRQYPMEGLEGLTPCMWKLVGQINGDVCDYFTVCLIEEEYPLVDSYTQAFPDDWDEAVDKYCVD